MASLEILIPSLPNDIALQCLARVPRQYHPVLSVVSKAIRSAVSSPEFFAVRSSLKCTEHLLYLGLRPRYDEPSVTWFTVFRRPNINSAASTEKGEILMARVPATGYPHASLEFSHYAAVGPKIYIFSEEWVWILDCRFNTWEQGPSMPMSRLGLGKTLVLDGKIYLIGWWASVDSWAHVFDTVTERWEALPSPKPEFYGKCVYGCAVRGGKVCVWVAKEELRFDPATKTWEVFGSDAYNNGLEFSQMCEVNGVLYCSDHNRRKFKFVNERIGVCKEFKFVNSGGLRIDWEELRMVNLGGRLMIMWWEEMEEKKGVWCAEFQVNKDGEGDLQGQVLWSEMVYLIDTPWLYYYCVPVSL